MTLLDTHAAHKKVKSSNNKKQITHLMKFINIRFTIMSGKLKQKIPNYFSSQLKKKEKEKFTKLQIAS